MQYVDKLQIKLYSSNLFSFNPRQKLRMWKLDYESMCTSVKPNNLLQDSDHTDEVSNPTGYFKVCSLVGSWYCNIF